MTSLPGEEKDGSLFREWALAFLGAAFLIVFDPLGLSDGADRLSERILLAVSAPIVAHLDPAEQTDTLAVDPKKVPPALRPADRITVVLVDEAFMAAYRLSSGKADADWPIPRRDQYELLLEPIFDQAPRALFVDWVWHQDSVGEAGELEALSASLRQFHAFRFGPKAREPLLLMADRPPRSPKDCATGEAFRWTDRATIGKGAHLAAPMVKLAEGTPWAARVATRWYGRADRYPLSPLRIADENDSGRNRFMPFDLAISSPALALFRAECRAMPAASNSLCGRLGNDAEDESLGFSAIRLSAEGAAEMMRLSAPQWLSVQSPAMRAIRRNTDPDHPCLANEGAGLWRGLLASLRLRRAAGEEEVPFNPCIAIDTVSARDLGTVTGEGLNQDALSRLLANRLVLLGVDLDAAPDRVTNPVNGSVPAVLLHATVLENMLANGRDRVREPPDRVGPIPEIALVGALLLAAVAAIPAMAIADRQLSQPQPAPIAAGFLLLVALMLAPFAGHWLGPGWAIAASAFSAGLLYVTAVLAPGWGRRLALPAVMLGGFLLPLSLALLLFFASDWAPANWVSGFTAKLFMIGGAASILRRVARLGPIPRLEELHSRMTEVPLVSVPLIISLAVLAALFWRSEVLPDWLVPLLLAIGVVSALFFLIWRLAGLQGLVLILVPLMGVAVAGRFLPLPDDGLMLAVGWGLTLAFLPLPFVLRAILERLKFAG